MASTIQPMSLDAKWWYWSSASTANGGCMDQVKTGEEIEIKPNGQFTS